MPRAVREPRLFRGESIQERLESSVIGQAVISAFVAVIVLFLAVWNLPPGNSGSGGAALRRDVMKVGAPVMYALGLDQNWGVFAPPRMSAIALSADIRYADGTHSTWRPPTSTGALFGAYRDYRWSKYVENAVSYHNPALLFPLVLWLARQHVVARDIGAKRRSATARRGVFGDTDLRCEEDARVNACIRIESSRLGLVRSLGPRALTNSLGYGCRRATAFRGGSPCTRHEHEGPYQRCGLTGPARTEVVYDGTEPPRGRLVESAHELVAVLGLADGGLTASLTASLTACLTASLGLATASLNVSTAVSRSPAE